MADANLFYTDPTAADPTQGGYIIPELSLPSQPVDAAGGAAGSYAQPILDLFKFGIGAALSVNAQNNALDYKKYETVNGRVAVNGVAAGAAVPGSGIGGMNTTTLMMLGGAVLIGLLLLKKAG